MKKDSKKKKLFLLLILVLTVSIGYAALATTLKINGNTTVKGLNWSVYWDNVQVTSGSVTGANVTTAPTTTGTTTTEVDFAVILPEPGDFYEFEVDAVNAGTIDAMIADDGIIKKAYSDANYTTEVTLPDVVRYTVTYADGTEIEDNHLLAKKSGNTPTRETYKVRVEYRNDEEINPSDLDSTNDRVYYLRFQVEYVQADGNATDSHPSAIHYVNRQVAGQITPGDEIGIGETEDFYVIASDSTKTVLLAKYNLLVGYMLTGDTNYQYVPIPTNTPGYGLQSVDAVGYQSSAYYMATPYLFSSTDYWMNENDLTSPYNANDTIYWDSENYYFKYRSDDSEAYPYVYDENSDLYQYISGENGYVNRLKAMGAPSTITGRLLTYGEANSAKEVGKSEEDKWGIYTSIIFTGQKYWLGSAYNNSDVWMASSSFGSENYGSDYNGVRPVIEIPTSEIR